MGVVYLFWTFVQDLFKMALYRYFAKASVPTRVPSLSERETKEANASEGQSHIQPESRLARTVYVRAAQFGYVISCSTQSTKFNVHAG